MLRCELEIIQLEPGSRALRWWFGEMGAGHSIVQVEGRFVDVQTGEELFTFVESRRGAAVFDVTGGDPRELIQQDLREIAKGIVEEFQSL